MTASRVSRDAFKAGVNRVLASNVRLAVVPGEKYTKMAATTDADGKSRCVKRNLWLDRHIRMINTVIDVNTVANAMMSPLVPTAMPRRTLAAEYLPCVWARSRLAGVTWRTWTAKAARAAGMT